MLRVKLASGCSRYEHTITKGKRATHWRSGCSFHAPLARNWKTTSELFSLSFGLRGTLIFVGSRRIVVRMSSRIGWSSNSAQLHHHGWATIVAYVPERAASVSTRDLQYNSKAQKLDFQLPVGQIVSGFCVLLCHT